MINNKKNWTYPEHKRLVEFVDNIKNACGSYSNRPDKCIAGTWIHELNEKFSRTLKPDTWRRRIKIARAEVKKQENIEAKKKVPIEKATPDMVGKWVECTVDIPEGGTSKGDKRQINHVSGGFFISFDNGLTNWHVRSFVFCAAPPTSEDIPIPYTVTCPDCALIREQCEIDIEESILDFIIEQGEEIETKDKRIEELERHLQNATNANDDLIEMQGQQMERIELAEARLEFFASGNFIHMASQLSAYHTVEALAKLVLMSDPRSETK